MSCTRKMNRSSNTLKCMLVCVAIIVMVVTVSHYSGDWKLNNRAASNHEDREKQAILTNVRQLDNTPTSYVEVINDGTKCLQSMTHAALRVSHRIEYNIEDFKLNEDISNVESEDNRENKVTNNTELNKYNQNSKEKYKVTHVGFLKVHKAGSTTMQNMLFRFGLRNMLTFALPKKGHYVRSTQGVLPVRNGTHRDILACHSVYKSEIFDKLLPSDSVKIGIIREPLDRMISAAFYYRDVVQKAYLRKVPTESFISSLIINSSMYDNEPFSRTKNSMGQDFGFSSDIKREDTSTINKRLLMLKKEFSLVLVMERFDESLVLMKRLLNWQLSDIIYLQSNKNEHLKEDLNSATITEFKKVNFLDQILYETFYDIFQSKVKEAGIGMNMEVKQFRSILKLVKGFCETAAIGNRLCVPKSMWNEVFYVSYKECELINTEELKFVSRLRERHLNMHSVK